MSLSHKNSCDNPLHIASNNALQSVLFELVTGSLTKNWYLTGTTILEAIREVAGAKTEVIYKENPSETLNGKDYSFAIVVVGEGPYVESGGDSSDLKIHFNGAELAYSIADQIPTLPGAGLGEWRSCAIF